MFKVGDFIRGKNSEHYLITNEEMTRARVTKTFYELGNALMDVKVISHNNPCNIGEVFTVRNSEAYFELVDSDKPKAIIYKFAIGSKVIVLDGSKIDSYVYTWAPGMVKYIGREFTVTERGVSPDGRVYYKLDGVHYTWDERGLMLSHEFNNWKVVIVPAGTNTIAKYYRQNLTTYKWELVHEVDARKHPDDVYDVGTGITEASKRLVDTLAEAEAKWQEARNPNKFDGKYVCSYSRDSRYKLGKIYVVKDGVFIDQVPADRGDKIKPSGSYYCLEHDRGVQFVKVIE